MTQAPHQTTTQERADAMERETIPALKPEQVLRPVGSSAHFEGHLRVRLNGESVGVYSKLGAGDAFGDAEVYLCIGGGGFSFGADFTVEQACEVVVGLQDAVRKVRAIHSLGDAVEVGVPDDWLHHKLISGRFVDCRLGGASFRVFASQVDRLTEPEVQLNVYSRHGFVAGSQMLPGFLSPDAADELADSLKAAAYQARMLAAQQLAEGGTQ